MQIFHCYVNQYFVNFLLFSYVLTEMKVYCQLHFKTNHNQVILKYFWKKKR
jgi:hypothetical protein